jgi:hypothetical protein
MREAAVKDTVAAGLRIKRTPRIVRDVAVMVKRHMHETPSL